jgi:HPr kinase/phosphorylase
MPVTVGSLLHSRPESLGLPLELLSGAAGLGRPIGSPHIQKTGLALVGFDKYLQPSRVLVFGESEVKFLESQEGRTRLQTLGLVFRHDVPCVLIAGGWTPPGELLEASERHAVPVLRTTLATPVAIAKLTGWLDDMLAMRQVIHGVLIDILGLGVLLIGESGIGKSECALDLVVRGHRLVADDTVEVRRRGENVVMGTCPDLTRHHMEVRGLGLINIRDLFGVASTRGSKRVELVVQLERLEPPSRGHGGPTAKPEAEAGPPKVYDRLGLEDTYYELLGLRIPLLRMPVAPGRSLAILIEVAARNQLLRSRGRHAARDFVERHERALRGETDSEPDQDEE